MGSLLGVEPSIRGSQPRVMPIHQKLHEAGAGRENRTPSLRFRKPPLCPVELRPHGWRGGDRTHGVLVYQTSALTTSPLSNETWLPLEDSNFLLTPSKGAGLPIIPSGNGWGNVNRTHMPRVRAECTDHCTIPQEMEQGCRLQFRTLVSYFYLPITGSANVFCRIPPPARSTRHSTIWKMGRPEPCEEHWS